MTPNEDRFAGSLIGQCLGDALGFLVEGEGPEVCGRYAGEVVLTRRVPRLRRGRYAFGQYSDDSQLARELVESWVERGDFDPVDYARRIAALFAEGRVVGHGRTTSEAAQRLIAGVPWTASGTPPPAAGNGSAMRAGPVGLMCRHDAEALVRIAVDQGRITHADPRCSAGAVAIAGAVALAAGGGPVEPALFLGALRRWTGRVEVTFAANLRQLEDWIELAPAEAAEHISRAGLPPGVDSQWRGGVSAFVVASVLWALYAFLRTPDDYVRTIATAIWPGGDVDTTAAMAGAISGARLGLGAIPGELAKHLNDQGTWRYPDLLDLARRAATVAGG